MSAIANSTKASIGGEVKKYIWHWNQQQVTIVYETLGKGTPILLLPAFSTVSTRGEMRGLAERLAPQFQVIAVDWVGFGESDRPPLDYNSALYHQFLADFVRDNIKSPIAVVAAGHAAGYVMQLAQQQPQVWSKIILAAPTWRGPFSSMGVPGPISGIVREIVHTPIIGQALYQLNTTGSFLRSMYGSHVYVDQAQLTPEFITKKRQITQQPGARYAPAAFVTGAIDPVPVRSQFLAYFDPLPAPVMVVIGDRAPSSSKAEMEALAELPGVETVVLPGALGLYEEYSDQLADAIIPFLASSMREK